MLARSARIAFPRRHVHAVAALLGGLLVWLTGISAAFAQPLPAASDTAVGDNDAGRSLRANEARPRPSLQMLRHEEDWSVLHDPTLRTGLFDPVKYVPLGGDAYATLGADVRLRHEYFTGKAYAYGRPDDDRGFLLQRYMLHGDLHAGERFRLFTQLKSNVVAGQAGPPRPIDKDVLDLHQLFADVALLRTARARITLRAGRQEISYGRMVSFREGPNVRLSFDALQLMGAAHRWHVESLIARPVAVVSGVFDDGWSAPRETLWGIRLRNSALRAFGERLPGLALYYLGQHREQESGRQGTTPETRHTVGVRLGTLPLRASGINLEGAVQWGTTGTEGGTVRAWFVAAEGARVFSELPLQPRLGLTAHATSGDLNPDDADLQGFRVPYPDNGLLGLALSSPFGTGNIYHVHPSLALQPIDALRLTLAWDLSWRQSMRGAPYGPGGRPLRAAPERRARFLGHMLRIGARLRLGRHVTVDAFYERFISRTFFEAGDAEAHAGFWGLQTAFKF